MKAFLEVLLGIIGKISGIMGKLYFHKKIFKWTGLFATKKFPEAKKQHKYAILVSARNEATVIGKLIESIRNQDYPAELITTFVIAHNCTDNTAEVVKNAGGVLSAMSGTMTQRERRALRFNICWSRYAVITVSKALTDI